MKSVFGMSLYLDVFLIVMCMYVHVCECEGTVCRPEDDLKCGFHLPFVGNSLLLLVTMYQAISAGSYRVLLLPLPSLEKHWYYRHALLFGLWGFQPCPHALHGKHVMH